MLRGVNDTPAQVAALAQRLRRPLYHLNLIAYNETGGEFARPAPASSPPCAPGSSGPASRHRAPSPGGDIEAACGQLALRHDRGGREPAAE